DRGVGFQREYEATTGQVFAGRRKQRQQVFRRNPFHGLGTGKAAREECGHGCDLLHGVFFSLALPAENGNDGGSGVKTKTDCTTENKKRKYWKGYPTESNGN